MSVAPLLESRSLGFVRDDLPLFAAVSFCLAPGAILQITGPNGCGKTTLMRLLTTAMPASSGELYWRGEPIARNLQAYRADLLYLGHRPGLKMALTPVQNLQWLVALVGAGNGDPSTDALIDSLRRQGLEGFEDVPCYTLSAGQLRRVALARLDLVSSKLWILDEPFTSLDRASVAQLERTISRHAESGGAVILTSHQEMALAGIAQLELDRHAGLC